MEGEQITKRLAEVNRECLDYLSLLNFRDTDEIEHMDIDVLVVLKKTENAKLSNFSKLHSFILEIRRVFGNEIHAFSTFKHEMFFLEELRKKNIRSKPLHLLVYPNMLYLAQWEIPSRIYSMFSMSAEVFKSEDFNPSEFSVSSEKYSPYPFLQILYEACILYYLANIDSKVVYYDVMKRIEFAIKNLTLEAFLKLGISEEKFATSWHYLMDNLHCVVDKDINATIVNSCFTVRKEGYDEHFPDIEGYFLKAFRYYDEVVKKIFQ